MQTTDISTLTVTELKALVYDEMMKLEIAQKNIKALNDEIYRKQSEPATPTVEDVTT